MSGHSKWSTIKRRKGANDQRRGKIFSKLSKAISIAAKEGGDPMTNFRLRLMVEKAKQENMPKENIARAIQKGSGKLGGKKWEEVVYEGYGPEGVAVIAEAVTDNKNRTTAEIKNIFERGGGRLVTPGAVSFQFKKSGLIVVEKERAVDNQLLNLIDLGVDDVQEATDAIEVYTQPEKLNETKEKIKDAGFRLTEAELVMQPKVVVKIKEKEKAAKIIKLMTLLEDNDDVQKVYANFDISEDVLEKVHV